MMYKGFSINRNIVECKEKKAENTIQLLLRINRNIVECKVQIAWLVCNKFQY